MSLQVQFCVIFNHIQIERKRIDADTDKKCTEITELNMKKNMDVNISQADGRFMSLWVRWADVFSLRDITFKFLVVIFTIKCTNHIAGKKILFSA